MHKQRLLVIIISIIGGAGSLGEWLTFLNQTLYGYTKPDGWAAVILFGIVLITALFGGFKSSFGIAKVITHAVLCVGAAGLGIYTIFQITDRLNLSSEVVSMTWGLPVLVVSAVAIPVIGYLMMEKSSSDQETSPK